MRRIEKVHNADEIITLFLYELDTNSRTVVANIQKSHLTYNYLEVGQYFNAEGDSVCARNRSVSKKLN